MSTSKVPSLGVEFLDEYGLCPINDSQLRLLLFPGWKGEGGFASHDEHDYLKDT